MKIVVVNCEILTLGETGEIVSRVPFSEVEPFFVFGTAQAAALEWALAELSVQPIRGMSGPNAGWRLGAAQQMQAASDLWNQIEALRIAMPAHCQMFGEVMRGFPVSDYEYVGPVSDLRPMTQVEKQLISMWPFCEAPALPAEEAGHWQQGQWVEMDAASL